jgi:glucuronoarabinoxylan endo-1,4-beta-xylanase
VPGTFVYTPALGTVESTAGSVTLSTTFTPTDTTNYNTATKSVTLTVTSVAKTTPTITWATPASIPVGTALSETQLDASASANGSKVDGTFVYTPAAGTVESTAGTVTLSTTFTPTDTATYNTATASVSLVVVATASTATVDFGTTEQTIRGFGVSEAWYGVMSNSQITSLYGTGSGDLGLSIMRLQIPPTTWTSSTQTADTSAWTSQVTNGKAAQALGATIFASPWTPPASMKTNNSQNEGSLSTSSYADYAAYLKAYVNYAVSNGVNLYAVSLQNEPDWNPCDPSGTDEGPTGKDCYDSCLWTPAQFDAWISGNGSVLTTGTNPVKLMMPESFYFAPGMSDPALNDPAAEPYISIIGGHLYGSSPTYYANAKNKGKDVWETEHYLSPVGTDKTITTIADGLAEAEELHNSMTVGQYNAYVWWWALQSKSTDTENYLLDSSGNPTYYGYALGQFSRFVRPGYVRVNATATPATGVYLSAYSGSDSSGTGHYVIVAINSTTSAISLPVSVENQTLTSLTPYQTTASGGLAAQSAVTVSGGSFTYTLPAQSITTFVQ